MTQVHRPRPERADSPELAAFRQLKAAQPELAGAVDMQVELFVMQRRVQARLSTPWLEFDAAWLDAPARRGPADPALRGNPVRVGGVPDAVPAGVGRAAPLRPARAGRPGRHPGADPRRTAHQGRCGAMVRGVVGPPGRPSGGAAAAAGGRRAGPRVERAPVPRPHRRDAAPAHRPLALDAPVLPVLRRRRGTGPRAAPRRNDGWRAAAARASGRFRNTPARTARIGFRATRRRTPAATGATASSGATPAGGISRPTMRATPTARSCSTWTRSPRCRSTRRPFSAGTWRRMTGLARIRAEEPARVRRPPPAWPCC